jgi:ubiquinone/menaquinone biosynthesis C-methylase UbiE
MNDGEAMKLFFEIHSGNFQEGPGDSNSTRKAFQLISGLPEDASVLDAGCGPGRQTIDLCRLTRGTVTAVDNHQPYLEALHERAKEAGLQERIQVLEADMAELPFEHGTFHLIWSEGAIYNIGFRNGLLLWRPLLKPGGWVAVTELTILREDPPEEPASFWKMEYPAVQTTEQNLGDLADAGYIPAGHFTLPESAWWHYYHPIRRKLDRMEKRYTGNTEALKILAMERKEIDMYRRYSNYYGYVFYVGKNDALKR